MSHTSTIKSVSIQSISALRAAVAELRSTGMNITLEDGGTPRAYYSNQQGLGPAAHVIKLGDCRYDVGVYPNGQGGYELRTDFWNGDVERILGAQASSPATRDQAKLGRIFQMYALHAAEEQAAAQGLTTQRAAGANGALELLVSGY